MVCRKEGRDYNASAADCSVIVGHLSLPGCEPSKGELCHHPAPATAVAAAAGARPGLAKPGSRGSAGLLAVMARTGSRNVSVHLWTFSCLVIVQSN